MTQAGQRYAFWILQEVFNYVLHPNTVAVNWNTLRLIVEAQKQVIASLAST